MQSLPSKAYLSTKVFLKSYTDYFVVIPLLKEDMIQYVMNQIVIITIKEFVEGRHLFLSLFHLQTYNYAQKYLELDEVHLHYHSLA